MNCVCRGEGGGPGGDDRGGHQAGGKNHTEEQP